jgi:fibronectin type 3 domain-containing protein
MTGSGIAPQPHSVDLSWDASTSVVNGYYVYRGSQTGGPYSRMNSTPQVGTAFTDSSVSSGATYFYVITAVDSNSVESINSSEVQTAIPTP